MPNVGLDEAEAGIKTARRNINNFRYVDNTTLRKRRGTKERLDEDEGECETKKKPQLKAEY